MPFDGNATSFQIVTNLEAMRELLKKGWVQGQPATTADGTTTFIADPEATHFCLLGALERVGGLSAHAFCAPTVRFLREHLQPGRITDIAKWNDNPRRTHRSVLRALSRLIRVAR